MSRHLARPGWLRALLASSAALSTAVSACHPEPKVGGAAPESARACEERQQRFVQFLEALPERSVAAAAFVDLPLTTLGVNPGIGPVLEVSAAKVVLDGQVLSETTLDARVQRVSRWLSERVTAGAPGKTVLYLAASADLDIHTLRAIADRVD